MDKDINKQARTETMKDIILKLHAGLSADQAKERFEKEIGNISSTEIADIEQTLIDEGLSPEEIKKFCNVHALIFQSALEKSGSEETFPSHPVFLFKLENREIEKLTGSLKNIIVKKGEYELAAFKEAIGDLLLKLRGIETHYERKEQLLFPYLEKQGFTGPSKVMWGKDNEIRDLLKTALAGTDSLNTHEAADIYAGKALSPLIEEVEGMIFKEEHILFPASLEKLSPGDWVEILRESDEVGYVFIEKPAETEVLMKNLTTALLEETFCQDNVVSMPTGTIRLDELIHIFNTLPVDLTFIDSEDTVRYFSDAQDRIFLRTKSIIGRKVQNCHPPQSVDVVEKILASFKDGKKDSYDFWINYQEKLIYIRYLALRDKGGQYLGTLEITQDITEIQKLKGEKRLIDERD